LEAGVAAGAWPDRQQRRVDALAQSLPNLAWERVSAGSGSKGERLYWPFCAHGEKKTPVGQVPLSVPELRPLLAHLLWRRWHGIEHLLHWSE